MFKLPENKRYLWQWSSNVRLEISDLIASQISEVHFYDPMNTIAPVMDTYIENGITYVDIPNILLTYGTELIIWGVKQNGAESLTELQHSIWVKKRQKPSDYVYTETEVRSYKVLEQMIRDKYDERKKWKQIANVTTTEEIRTLIITEDSDGKSFELDEIVVSVRIRSNASANTSTHFRFGTNASNINDYYWQSGGGVPSSGYRCATVKAKLYGDMVLPYSIMSSLNTSSAYGAGYVRTLQNADDTVAVESITAIVIDFVANAGIGSQIVVYGRVAA